MQGRMYRLICMPLGGLHVNRISCTGENALRDMTAAAVAGGKDRNRGKRAVVQSATGSTPLSFFVHSLPV
jgi:hypothetical protein